MAGVSKKSLTLTVLFTYYMKGLEEEKMEDDKEKKQEKTIPSVSMEELRNMINSKDENTVITVEL
jgi:hypothetical protein